MLRWYVRRCCSTLELHVLSELGAFPYAAMFTNAPTTPTLESNLVANAQSFR